MPTRTIPLTTYLTRSNRANQALGSPAVLPMRSGGPTTQVFARVPLDKIPLDANITSAVVRLYADRSRTGTEDVAVRPITSGWRARVTWNNKPTVGDIISTATVTNPVRGSLFELDVTTWAQTRDRRGLRFSTTTDWHHLRGSSAGRDKPVLVVTYTVPPTEPGDLKPDGGSVSVSQPILTYAGDPDMTEQEIQFSDDGVTSTFSTGWQPASDGYYDMTTSAVTGEPALVDGGVGTYWRVRTRGADGTSPWSAWAWYDYRSLPDVTIVNPPDTTDDGTPPLEWTVAGERQTAFRASLFDGSRLLSRERWNDADATRAWTPGKGVRTPGGGGLFMLEVRDDVSPRVATVNAPTVVRRIKSFSTVAAGTGPAINSIAVTFDDPVPTITGTRDLGTPDEVSLFRDGVQVPLWDEDGNAYKWAPGTVFFQGTTFSIPDYTAEPRAEHTWKVKVKAGGVTSADGPTVTAYVFSEGVWIVDPRTGSRVDVQGIDELPVVEQETAEAAILHYPVNGGPVIEPKRRRLTRSTRQGTLSGAVLGDHEAVLEGWSEADSGLKYRLVFGKVNWSVIIGDYSPADVMYQDRISADRVAVSMSWWQRLEDV